MEKTGMSDLMMNGVATAAGGHYRNVRVDGVGKVEGSLEAERFDANGVLTVKGSIRARELAVNGRLKVEGGLAAAHMRIDGIVRAEGDLSGDRLELNGICTVRGDMAFERIDAAGTFHVDGLVNAGHVGIRLFGQAKAREIGGDTIRVGKTATARWKTLLRWVYPKWHPELVADTIEGDDIELAHTIAETVRGERVAIGPGCRIGRVEYRSELRVHASSQVGEEVKSGDGNGRG
ncbi:MAG: hypothetical protein J7639_21500 [Paenibacillaceae bacterium]|nr:hypothetical protein [Paenibacillaceae bacterium]